ncbi:uncharacterized protein LOC126789413 [Argentina anserina]|uniref:uncharacterized protein LOC126789413 n=1 Tax=Argentina anserina TaxID=57926 RepID=UPI0021761FD8|nr:uncharacterized protein LOC126789413 [Potentilla anserina]
MSPSTTHNFLFTLFLIFFITAASAFWPESNFPPNFHSLYTHHCNDVVPNSHAPNSELAIDNGYFTGGDSLFGQTPNTTALNFQRKVYFQAKYDGPILRGYLILANESAPGTTGLFSLNGHYSDSVSKLCMVGGGSVGVVLKLKYPKNSSIFDSLVTGTLEFVSGENDTDVSSLGLISILGLSQKSGYQPTFIDSLVGSDRGESLGMDSLSLEQLGGSIQSVCKLIGGFRVENYELEYESGYGNLVGGDVGYVSTMLVSETWCEDGKMQMLLRFLNSSVSEGYSFPLEPRTTLIAEGEWVDKENRMLVVACRILNFTESLTNAVVGDCSTRLDFTFPARLSLRNRARIVGHIWSNRTVGDIGFHTLSEQSTGVVVFMYEFTEYDTVKKLCDVKTRGGKGKKYPDEHSAEMNLHMVVRNGTGQTGGAHLFPLFVDGDQSSVVNMSYELIFRFTDGFNFFDKGSSDSTRVSAEGSTRVSAEGIYNRDNGYLCMIACRHAFSKDQELMENDILARLCYQY